MSKNKFKKNKFNPEIIFILETLTNNHNSCRILKALHFDKTLIIDSLNHCGGIWVCWNSANIVFANYVTNQRCVHLEIVYKPNNKCYSITEVYCPTKENDKDPFCQYLHTYFANIAHPWLLLGDFHEMLSTSDKQGGRPLSTHSFRLPNLLANSNGVDIPCLQKAFSWKNS